MQLFLEFESVATLMSQVEKNLSKGRAFVSGSYDLKAREACELVLVHPQSGEQMLLAAEAVHFSEGDHAGVGVALLQHGPEQTAALEAFIESRDAFTGSRTSASDADVSNSPKAPPDSRRSEPSAPSETEFRGDGPAGLSLQPVQLEPSCRAESESRRDQFAEGVQNSRVSQPESRPPPNVHQRVRALAARDRERLARSGTLSERTALERAFGSSLWEALLQNPQITGPEISRIAKNGTISQPLLNVIVSNAAWIQKSEVRRSLLSNPRLSAPHIERVLRVLPKNELKMIPKQSAYPARVRAAAMKYLPR